MDETALYPTSYDTFTDQEAKQDVADKSLINKFQNIFEAMQAELGLNPSGTATTLVARLAKFLADNGAIAQGTSFPVTDLVKGQGFFRTDLDAFYIRNNANDAWLSQLQNFSNVLFNWFGIDDSQNHYVGNSLTPSTGYLYEFRAVEGTTPKTILRGKLIKLPGMNTISILARIWSRGGVGYQNTLTVNVGGQSNTVVDDVSQTPKWYNPTTIDISGLTNGTVYDITVTMVNQSGGGSYCSALVLVGS